MRAGVGSALCLGGLLALLVGWVWVAAVLWVVGLFCLAEAAGAWCVVRACGWKTKW